MASWLSEQVEQELADKGWHYKQRQIQNGMQFTLDDGTCINWYSTGKVVVAGKQTPLRSILNHTYGTYAQSAGYRQRPNLTSATRIHCVRS